MQVCSKCNISIRGNKRCCPLCRGKLEGKPENAAFPVIQRKKVGLLLKTVTFITCVSCIVLGLLAFFLENHRNLVGMIMAGVLLIYLDITLAIYYRRNLIKLIHIEALFVMILTLLIDHDTGMHGWSLAAVWPACFLVLVLVTILTGTLCGLYLEDYIIYLILDVFLSLIQLIPVFRGSNPFPWPAMITVAVMLILFSFVIIFRRKEVKDAWAKYLSF